MKVNDEELYIIEKILEILKKLKREQLLRILACLREHYCD